MSLPLAIKSAYDSLTDLEKASFTDLSNRRQKAVGMGYVLWFLVGLHYAYTRKWGLQFLFWFTVGGVGVWWIIDFFRVPGIIRQYNDNVMVDSMKDIKAMR